MPLYWMVKENIHHGASGILVWVWKHWVHFIFNFQQSVYMALALELDTQIALNIADNSIKIITFNKEKFQTQLTHSLCIQFKHS